MDKIKNNGTQLSKWLPFEIKTLTIIDFYVIRLGSIVFVEKVLIFKRFLEWQIETYINFIYNNFLCNVVNGS